MGVEYSIIGGATPSAIALPATGPATNALSSSFLTYEDMRGALNAPAANASVQVCSPSAGIVNPGHDHSQSGLRGVPGNRCDLHLSCRASRS